MNLKDIIFSNIYKRPLAFGLDISDFSIKIAQLERKKKGFELRNFNRAAIPKGVIEEGRIKKEEKLVEIIKKSIAEVKGKDIKTSYAICSLPEQYGFVKIIQLPKMKLEEARKAIKWEAEANIPLSLEEVYLDWQVINFDGDRDHLDILINAVPKDLVDKYLQVLRTADIEPMVFEIESIATARSLIKDGFSPKPVLIIDLGFSRTSFIIFAGYSVRFTSSIPVSSQQMISDIAKKLGVSQKEAQLLKFKVGLNRKKERGRVFNALLPSLTKLVDQIEDCLNFYKEHIKEAEEWSSGKVNKEDYQSNISTIILCGGGAYLEDLPEYFSNRLKIPAILGNPWVNILYFKTGSKIPGIPYKESLAYSTALGLALRGVQIGH